MTTTTTEEFRTFHIKNRLRRRGLTFLEAWAAAEVLVAAAPDPLEARAARARN